MRHLQIIKEHRHIGRRIAGINIKISAGSDRQIREDHRGEGTVGPDLLEPAARPPLRSGDLCLVRPDGYTACVAKDGDTGVLAAYLDALKNSASAA